MSERTRAALPWLLAAACLIYDPAALAADAKRSIGLLLAVAGTGSVLLRSELPAFHPALRALVACVAWLALSALFGGRARWLVLGNWCLLVALATALASLGVEKARAITGRTALLVTAVICAWLFEQWLLGGRRMQLHAGQGNPNWAGLVLAVAWPLALADSRIARLRPPATAAFALAVATALVLTQSRVGWVAAGLALLAATAVASRRRERLSCASHLVALVVAVSVFALMPRFGASPSAASPTAETRAQPAPRARHVPELDRSASTSLQGRLWIARMALDVALERLPFGTGLGGFFPAFLEAQGKRLALSSASEASRRFSNATTAHNDWLELGAEASPLAPALLAAALGLAARAWLKARDHALCAGVVGVAVAALADSPFHLPAVCTLLAPAFGSLPSVSATHARTSTRARFWAVALLLGCAFLFSRSLAAWLSTRVASAASFRPPGERVALLDRAARLAPDSPERALELGLARRDTGDVRGALRAIERATELGGDVASYIALGAASLDASEFVRALGAFEHALALNPGSVRAHSGLSEALRRLGRLDAAESHAALASQLLPGDAGLRARLDSIREERVDHELELEAVPR